MAEERKVYPVSAVNNYVKRVLEKNEILRNIWISGEISNFKRHSSGHLYFTIKDAQGAISCVMFASDAYRLKFRPYEGCQVEAQGQVSLYEAQGKYQFYIHRMEEGGVGDLYRAFEEMKRKLEAEGLFDPACKKSLPFFPGKVGVVTSPTGAAFRDICQIAKRRYPGVSIVLYPAMVQGESAAPTIVKGIQVLDQMEDIDVIIVGRGGGSMEDLWAFNEEIVARAVFEAKTPVISAVGHETDFTICDFVSDMRAPTPSAAAELAVPEVSEIRNRIRTCITRGYVSIDRYVRQMKDTLKMRGRALSLLSPGSIIRDRRLKLDNLSESMKAAVHHEMELRRMMLSRLERQLELSSPLHPLTKGYAMITSEKGDVVSSVRETKIGENVIIQMADGKIRAQAEEILEGSLE